MILRPPRSTRTDTLFPYTTLFRSDAVVGGTWPEIGFLLPTPSQHGRPDPKPLAPGEEVILSDAIVVLRPDLPSDERDSARHFLQMLGAAYQALDLPPVESIGRASCWERVCQYV